ncbi:glycoside hydrolase family 65 protein [Vibrio cholerae]
MMQYHHGQGIDRNWLISESGFDARLQAKCETIMSLGNGYLGLRSSTEEGYFGQTRGFFVAGTFNSFDDSEVTELPNAADLVGVEIELDGERFSLETGETKLYRRDLNIKTGELCRQVTWVSPAGKSYELVFRRFVSLADIHLIGQRIEITPLEHDSQICVRSGIDGQSTNSGVQHFLDGEKRQLDKHFLQQVQHTTESNIDFVANTTHRVLLDGVPLNSRLKLGMGRRQIHSTFDFEAKSGQTLVVEKLSNIYTSRDKLYDHSDYQLQVMRDNSLEALKKARSLGYDALLNASINAWQEYWNQVAIEIEGNDFDQLAIRFAHYHLLTMTPSHDNRFGIAAKGLSGEGYKGHSFWDTEIFLVPFFAYTQPEKARSLLEYRYQGLTGARQKALEHGYTGAMYPWESAFDGREVTPLWGACDVVTGKASKVWCGIIEQHISADIAYAVWQYYQITGDEAFMARCGYEILFETASFWTSRLEWLQDRQLWGFNNVIGPDEFKEHVDNNAFTNYMAHWNICQAIECYERLDKQKSVILTELESTVNLTTNYSLWKERVSDIYLPQPREGDQVIPQDDTYLEKAIIDLSKYKNQSQVGTIFKDLSRAQVNDTQVSKQADILMLFYLMQKQFPLHVQRANWDYYEPKTLHDSSLSLSIHSILATDMGERTLAYEMFERAARIDLGPDMSSSDAGMHTASIGGVWQAIVCGFAGVRQQYGQLCVTPNLPTEWKRLTFPLCWQGTHLNFEITDESLTVTQKDLTEPPVQLQINGQLYATGPQKLQVSIKANALV